MKILVFGTSGMIGHAMFRVLSENAEWEVFGTLRNVRDLQFFPSMQKRIVTGVDVNSHDALVRVFSEVRPDVVVNCIGLTKHHKEAADPLQAIPINALLPHRMAQLCEVVNARFIHVSTDCVFSGKDGLYREDAFPDANDLYGKSKFLGEVNNERALTLRTSTIGHELQSAYGLLEWFLAQENECKGFKRAIFSGLPNVVFAQVVRDIVLVRPELHGLYHVGAAPIDKFDLLSQIAAIYRKKIKINPDEDFSIDRSLDVTRFTNATGYVAPDWPTLLEQMYLSQYPQK
ncbi:dTDP-4-dehydrorhamnose reductase [Herbaspirillum sp. Sphag1AN]|uniref:dTDP-4-dehydrorhamnose reductase family protein n=1 Tax=unclassified Herbaspirillum TaxID=2624150 RepID=UPI00160A4692|nr:MULTISPECIES: SDR family oxidoreductase [unclassified Herbaspirillum]MBB3212974.1 dTDP-4-dehydrorhamnose reductase [Herbaspirillum sp. Sphag1AN]MBB3246171.1 dTDP-4-dehydrorhamnose reductase [Herbaspirillum sp. Sphag64]